MTCRPYQPITLTTFSARIAELDVRPAVSPELSPSLKMRVELEDKTQGNLALDVQLDEQESGNMIFSERVHSGVVKHWNLTGKVELWWLVG